MSCNQSLFRWCQSKSKDSNGVNIFISKWNIHHVFTDIIGKICLCKNNLHSVLQKWIRSWEITYYLFKTNQIISVYQEFMRSKSKILVSALNIIFSALHPTSHTHSPPGIKSSSCNPDQSWLWQFKKKMLKQILCLVRSDFMNALLASVCVY